MTGMYLHAFNFFQAYPVNGLSKKTVYPYLGWYRIGNTEIMEMEANLHHMIDSLRRLCPQFEDAILSEDIKAEREAME